MRRKILFSIFVFLLISILTACSSNNGIDNNDQEEIVSIEVSSIEDLNNAFSTNVSLIKLTAAVEGDGVIENRDQDLILDLNGFNINGNLQIGIPSLGSTGLSTMNIADNWRLEIISSIPGGKITGDITIYDSQVIINKEELFENEIVEEEQIEDFRLTISGKISFSEDFPGEEIGENTLVAVVSNSHLEISSFEELEIIASTYADNSGNYSIEGVPVGKYYVIAYKEVNGTDELEFVEIDGFMEAVEPNGAYCDETEEPLQIEVDEDWSNVDILLSTEADRYNFNIELFAPLLGEEPVSSATISLYSKSGVLIDSTEPVLGMASFTGIYGGCYYLETGEAWLDTIELIDTRTPVYRILEQDNSEGSNFIDIYVYMSLFSEQDIKDIFDITDISNYGFVLFAEDVDEEFSLSGDTVELTPAVSDNDIGYSTFDSIDQPPYLDFSSSFFPEADEGDTYLAGIRNLQAGSYMVGLEGDPEDEKELIEVETGKLIYIEMPEIIF